MISGADTDQQCDKVPKLSCVLLFVYPGRKRQFVA